MLMSSRLRWRLRTCVDFLIDSLRYILVLLILVWLIAIAISAGDNQQQHRRHAPLELSPEPSMALPSSQNPLPR